MQREATVEAAGQVTIPREIREVLRISEGDTVIFEADDGVVRLRPRTEGGGSVFRGYTGVLREGEGKSTDEIVAEIRAMRGHAE